MFVIVMGVSGSGKSTIGRALAEKLQCRFYDGDDFHPPANVTKMASGLPLDDEDRAGWLDALAALVRNGLEKGEDGVVACSALKNKYRRVLNVDAIQVKFVYLKGSYETIQSRMQQRAGHYMRPAMLQSQFETLEEPADALVEDISRDPAAIVEDIIQHL